MLRFLPKARPALRILLTLLSSALFAYLIWQAGPGKLWENVVKLGWGFVWVLALTGVSHIARALAWRLTLDDHKHKTSFPRLLGLRLGAEAAGQLGFIGQTFGDSIRVAQLSPQTPIANGLASVTLDRGLYIATGMIVLVAGLVGALPLLSHSHALRFYVTLFLLALLSFLFVTLLAVRKRWPVISRSARLFARVPFLRRWMESRYTLIEAVENALLNFHHNSPRAFWGSFLLILASHCMAVIEVCLILWLMGVKFGILSALVVEAMTKLVNAVGSINPGNVGIYEGGTMLIVKMFGLTGAIGLTLGVARRLRAFFWASVGGICLLILSRSRNPHDTQDGRGAAGIAKEKAGAEAAAIVDIAAQSSSSAIAIFLPAGKLGNEQFDFGLARVGSLPILLRNILGAHKLGPSRIVVVVDPVLRRLVQRQLWWTRRLPESVQWIEAKADVPVLQQLQLTLAQGGSERIVIIDGTRTYHPSLLQKAREWDGKNAGSVLSSGGKPVGICVFNAQVICDSTNSCPGQPRTLQELLAALAEIHSVDQIPVAEDLWQQVDTEEDRQSAERKLDHWLVKPTDGFYARLNRRISIPISRQLIKLPITANMVSIFTLGVGMASAAFFAYGGYWSTLLGALLCLFASILDGCDGEVARLKLQESDFGCWLETICDYAFYLFLLVGMTIGRWRSSGTRMYLVCGGLLLFGALASFFAVGWQRRRLAAGRPEQLLKIWQRHAESRQSNPFLYFGRHTEFIVRRCFFPYALLVFALFNLMNVAFVLSVIGANLVWPIALYSSLAFARPKRHVVGNCAPSSQNAQPLREYVPDLL
jgi:phosphatidylglycerophosphate synthase